MTEKPKLLISHLHTEAQAMMTEHSQTALLNTEVYNLCPRAVADIKAWQLYNKPDGNIDCVGSLEKDMFIAVPESKVQLVLEVAALLDGTHSLLWIQDYYRRECGQQVDIVCLYELLSSANLIADPRPAYVFRGEFRRFSIDLIDIDTRVFFERLQPHAQRLLKPLVAFTLALIILGLLSSRTAFLASDNLYLIGNSFLGGYIVLALFRLLFVLIHEFAHAFVGAAYGAIARHLRVALYMGFIPYFYTQITGLYTLQPAKRIKVWMAGCYSNIFLGCIGLIAYYMAASRLSPVVGQIILKAALANFFMILRNLSPLMPTDGYFIMSTLLKQVNIRTNAFQEFFKWIKGGDNKLKGTTLVYFVATSLIIAGGFIVQVRWFIGMSRELFQGTFGLSTFQSYFCLSVFGLLLVLRLFLVFVIKARKKRAFSSLPSQVKSVGR